MDKLYKSATALFILACAVFYSGCGESFRTKDPLQSASASGYYLHHDVCYLANGNNADPAKCANGKSNYIREGYCYSPNDKKVPGSHCNLSYYFEFGFCKSSDGYVVEDHLCSPSSNSGYREQDGSCLDKNNKEVNGTHCNMEYFIREGYCFRSAPEQSVSQDFCLATSGKGCKGNYLYPTFDAYIPVTCNGADCQGRLLYTDDGNGNPGDPVYCE